MLRYETKERKREGRGCFLLGGWVEGVVVGVAVVGLVLVVEGDGNGTKNGANDRNNGMKICRW